MKVHPGTLDGLLLIEPDVHGDDRGFFTETWQRQRYAECGVTRQFAQDNLSRSVKNTLRGLHFQIRHPQAKLVQVLSGEIFDVAVDIRPDSHTFGQWEGFVLSGKTLHQLFIPEGFAHGFCVLSETALFSYKCSAFYAPRDEGGLLWSDPAVGIDWPVSHPLLSDKDRRYPCLKDLGPHQLPQIKAVP